MRSTKIVSALVAVVMALSTMLALPAVSATSAGNGLATSSAAKPKHDLKIIDAGEVGNTGRFFVKGKVSTYTKKKITIQRKVGNGPFRGYKKPRTNKKGKFSATIDGPVGSCFKVVVPKKNGYKTTKQKIGCIVKA